MRMRKGSTMPAQTKARIKATKLANQRKRLALSGSNGKPLLWEKSELQGVWNDSSNSIMDDFDDIDYQQVRTFIKGKNAIFTRVFSIPYEHQFRRLSPPPFLAYFNRQTTAGAGKANDHRYKAIEGDH